MQLDGLRPDQDECIAMCGQRIERIKERSPRCNVLRFNVATLAHVPSSTG